METALWDATTLALYSSSFPNVGTGTRGQASGMFYMGADFASQQKRISGNLKRVSEFKSSTTSSKTYITLSCADPKKICGKVYQGNAIGGYTETVNGWFGYYHYITFCPPFFTIDTLSDKINDIEQDLAGGNTNTASDMTWLRTTGQYFLHELMHTRVADGGVEPHINDEYLVPADGSQPDDRRRAYGPRLVQFLARKSGASRSSTNADSYALLANAAW